MNISLFSLDIILLIILIAIFVRNFDWKYDENQSTKKYERLVLAQVLSIIGECVFNFALNTDNNVFIRIMTFIILGSNYALSVFFFRYIIVLTNAESKKINIIVHIVEVLFAIVIVLFFTNLFTEWIDNLTNIHKPDKTIFLIFRFIPVALVFITSLIILIASKSNLGHKLTILSYSFFPCFALFFEYITDYFFMNIGFSVAVILIYINIQFDNRKKMLQQENELLHDKVEIMLSQIQPHFLYNSLSAITMLCDTNPAEVKNYISDFSKYLRVNLESLKLENCISFEKEMEHVNLYLKFEKLRFEEKLNIEYDIRVKDFKVPSLSIQPIVENAVTHGICKLDEGGTIKISTEENQKAYIIKVEDNGAGFDTSTLNTKELKKNNVCIYSIKNRLASMLYGSLEVKSKIGEGTIVTIIIPK